METSLVLLTMLLKYSYELIDGARQWLSKFFLILNCNKVKCKRVLYKASTGADPGGGLWGLETPPLQTVLILNP